MPPKSKSATIKDVAAFAGVSIKTVSNVVNGWPYITDETRQKVLDAIQAVGYRPNQMARSLVTGKTRTVGVVIPDIANPFFAMAMRGCEDSLYEGEHNLFLCNTNEDVERERYNIDLLISRGVDALVLWGTRLCCSDLLKLVGPDLPLVTIDLDEAPMGPNHTVINIDNVGGACEVTQHLASLGRKRIYHLAGPMGRMTAENRLRGFQQALSQAGLLQDSRVFNAAPSIQGGYLAMQEAIKSGAPDALFCYNDLIAVGAMIAARDAGLNIPNDLAVAGFDDILMASMTTPPLTTARIPQYELGRLAGQIVLARLHAQAEVAQEILYPVSLQVRGATDATFLESAERRVMLDHLIASSPDAFTRRPGKTEP